MGSQTGYAVWDKYWSRQNSAPQKDDVMSLFLAHQIKSTCKKVLGRFAASLLEMGAGSGRTSRYLNEMGASTGILDVSEEALTLAKFVTQGLGNPVDLYLADIFKVEKEAFSTEYEVVWNAGVIEHFPPNEQTEIIRRMAVPLKNGGVVLLLTPYSGSLLYRVGKFILEKLKAFPYGSEIPIASVNPILPKELELVSAERSVGFVILLFNAFKALSSTPLLGPVFFSLNALLNPCLCFLFRLEASRRFTFFVDRILSKLFGGYLLLSVCRRKQS